VLRDTVQQWANVTKPANTTNSQSPLKRGFSFGFYNFFRGQPPEK
jgi:hypothetical protein